MSIFSDFVWSSESGLPFGEYHDLKQANFPGVYRMRSILWGCLLLSATSLSAEQIPLVEPFLHSGEFNKGEQSLQRRLEDVPTDDQARFGLGVLQVLRGVERLGQGLYLYGVKRQGDGEMFIRLPIPENPEPATITYPLFRRMLDDFRRDLELAEATLATVKDEQVKLPLHLADIAFDLDHDGKATDSFLTLLQRFDRGNRLELLKKNPQLHVTFDRGDVAWLRAYCHILMGFLDGLLSMNNEAVFNMRAPSLFAKPKSTFMGTEEERRKAWSDAYATVRTTEPHRWHRLRLHFVQAAALNKETWEHIRKETDNDAEWLPNAKQTSMLGLRVNDSMIDAWLGLWDELSDLFEGKKTLPYVLSKNVGNEKPMVGVNLKRLLDDPPEALNDIPPKLDDRYFTNDPEVDVNRLIRWYFTFGTSPIPFAMWFN